MAGRRASSHDALRIAPLTFAVGLAAGLLLWLLTALATNSTIGGGWSQRGNGALIIPLAGIPAVLAGGWAGLARWLRGRQALPSIPGAGGAAGFVGAASSFLPWLLPVALLAPLGIAGVAIWADRRILFACLALPLGVIVGLVMPLMMFGVG